MKLVTTAEESAHRPGLPHRVAIIGSGPGGLVAARYLKHHGFDPVIFEQGDQIGGQWNVRSPHSGVWPSMVTNTSRFLTCFRTWLRKQAPRYSRLTLRFLPI